MNSAMKSSVKTADKKKKTENPVPREKNHISKSTAKNSRLK